MNIINMELGAFPGCESSTGKTERLYVALERAVLNPLGYIPLASSISGPIRILIGLIQAIAYAFFSFFASIGEARALSARYACTMKNGLANIFRGCIESIPIAGNILCYAYDSNGLSIQYLGERTDMGALARRFLSNVELSRGRTLEHSCFQNPNEEVNF